MKNSVSQKFAEIYGEGAILFASPGRINLIGEHTDYNGGFVFPGAVDKGIVAAIRLNGTLTSLQSSALTRRISLHRAGLAISSVFAVRFRSVVVLLAVLIPYLRVMSHLVLV